MCVLVPLQDVQPSMAWPSKLVKTRLFGRIKLFQISSLLEASVTRRISRSPKLYMHHCKTSHTHPKHSLLQPLLWELMINARVTPPNPVSRVSHTFNWQPWDPSWSLRQSIKQVTSTRVLMSHELCQLQPHLFCQSLKSAPGDTQSSKATWRPARSSGKLVHMSQIDSNCMRIYQPVPHWQVVSCARWTINSYISKSLVAIWIYEGHLHGGITLVSNKKTVYWEVHWTSSNPAPAAPAAPWPPPGSTKTAVCRSCRPNLSKAEVQDLNISSFDEAKAC